MTDPLELAEWIETTNGLIFLSEQDKLVLAAALRLATAIDRHEIHLAEQGHPWDSRTEIGKALADVRAARDA